MLLLVILFLAIGYKIYWYVKESKKNRYENG